MSSASARPSIGWKPGLIPASAGKLARRVWAKPWIVWMRKPPGVSRTRANKRRARCSAGGSLRLAEREQIVAQRDVGHPHPGGKPGGDAVGHFGGAGLGEGQAQDRAGIDLPEEQAEDSRGEDLGLAGARRSRQSGVRHRVRSALLVAFENGKGFEAARHVRLP